MATVDLLLCLGGPIDGQQRHMPKEHNNYQHVDWEKRHDEKEWVSQFNRYRRVRIQYEDQPGAYSVLVHSSIEDDDVPALIETRKRQERTKGSRKK